MIHSEVHVWGDSLGRCIVYQTQKQRYAISSVRYAPALENELGIQVHNHSVMGWTVADGLAAFLQSAPAPGALCAIEFGGNDCDLDWPRVAAHPQEEITAKVPLPAYRQTLADFVAAARARGMRPLLVTPPPLHGLRYFRWVTRQLDGEAVLEALGGDVQHIYRWQERYAVALRDVATQTGCPVLDMRDAFLARRDYESLMCEDGIHPNEQGHQLIAETALRFARGRSRGPGAQGNAGNVGNDRRGFAPAPHQG